MNMAITSKIQVSFLVQYIFEESNVRKESHILEISILNLQNLQLSVPLSFYIHIFFPTLRQMQCSVNYYFFSEYM